MKDADKFLVWGRTPEEQARLANERCAGHPRADELEWIPTRQGPKLVTRPGWYRDFSNRELKAKEEERQKAKWRMEHPLERQDELL